MRIPQAMNIADGALRMGWTVPTAKEMQRIEQLIMKKNIKTRLVVLLIVAMNVTMIASVSPAYNSYSYRNLYHEAHDYTPLGLYGRSYVGPRLLRSRVWMRYQSAYNAQSTGNTMEMRQGWVMPVWTQNVGPQVRTNNSTSIRWEANQNYMLEFSKSDTQGSTFSCDAMFDGPAYRITPPGSPSWVTTVNPDYNWNREVFIEVNWAGVVTGFTLPTIIDCIGIPSYWEGMTGVGRTSNTGQIAGATFNGYVSIDTPNGTTAESHSTGWIDHH